MEFVIRPAGSNCPKLVVRRSLLTGTRVFCAGHWLRPRGRRSNLIYDVPRPDGTTQPLQLTGGLTGLIADFDGKLMPLERKLRAWEIVLMFLPFVGIIGGAMGGLLGIIGFAANYGLVRSQLAASIRAGIMLGVTVLVLVGWIVIASALLGRAS